MKCLLNFIGERHRKLFLTTIKPQKATRRPPFLVFKIYILLHPHLLGFKHSHQHSFQIIVILFLEIYDNIIIRHFKEKVSFWNRLVAEGSRFAEYQNIDFVLGKNVGDKKHHKNSFYYARNNFQKKILDLNVLERLEKKFTGAANKAPYLYRFI
jgi:hypothetical protein